MLRMFRLASLNPTRLNPTQSLGRGAGILVSLLLPALWGSPANPTVEFSPSSSAHPSLFQPSPRPSTGCQRGQTSPNFLVMGGGGAPSYNEIALEKNVLYFQRTLQTLGFDPADAHVFFANGTDGQATIRYLNGSKELFKVPEIPQLAGASTLSNFQGWLEETAQASDPRAVFFYFTGHGYRNPADFNNNAMILWGEDLLSVQQFATSLDQLPPTTPVVTMMAQCYAGAFANFIYEGGDPSRSVALQTRCGFFATIKTRPSVGCTPEVNEADYRDYSSSFFAGLSGRDRTGQPVSSADYNEDGSVSYAEAHAFAKVDEQSTDLPVSTLEVWLQEQSNIQEAQILEQPIAQILTTARPEQRYVVETLAKQFGWSLNQPYGENVKRLNQRSLSQEQAAYLVRLGMELFNIGAEQQVRQQGKAEDILIIDRLITCEASSWSLTSPNAMSISPR